VKLGTPIPKICELKYPNSQYLKILAETPTICVARSSKLQFVKLGTQNPTKYEDRYT
jgi:hypothetical protein